MEGIYENLEALSPKQRQTLEDNREQAFLSKRLATIDINVPVEFDEAAFNLDEPDKETLRELFKTLEFRTLAKRVLNEDPAIGPAHQTDLFGNAVAKEAVDAAAADVSELRTFDPEKQHYELADTVEKQEQLVAQLLAQTEISFDTETTGTDANMAELVGLSFSWKENTGWYVPVPADSTLAKEIVNRFRPVLESNSIAKIGQNLKYDWSVLRENGFRPRGLGADTMVAAYLLAPEGRHNLQGLADQYLGYTVQTTSRFAGKEKINSPLIKSPLLRQHVTPPKTPGLP
jgi:DNA polymerase-1